MSEKSPEPNSLDSMGGIPVQDTHKSEQVKQQTPEEAGKVKAVKREEGKQELQKVRTELENSGGDTEPVGIPPAEEMPGLIRLPPSFYREMITLSYRNGDRETFDKFRKAVTAEEKSVIEKDALQKSETYFRQFSDAVSSLDFVKGDLMKLHDALAKLYNALSGATSELQVIELVSGSGSNRRGLLMRYLDKVHLLVSDLCDACQGEAYRQEQSLWVRMFSKDRSRIIALSEVLKDYQQGIEKTYGTFSGGEDLDHESSARLLVPTWPRPKWLKG